MGQDTDIHWQCVGYATAYAKRMLFIFIFNFIFNFNQYSAGARRGFISRQ